MTQDKTHPAPPAPEGEEAAVCKQDACEAATVSPELKPHHAPEEPEHALPQNPTIPTAEKTPPAEEAAQHREDRAEQGADDASPDPAPIDAPPAETPQAPKPISFLGRRGTGAIRVEAEATTEKTCAEDSAAAVAPPPAAPSPSKPGMAENSFRAMSFLGLAFLLILLALQTAVGVWFPSVYLPAETAVAEVFGSMAASGHWLAPAATAALPASLPGYYWFMGLVSLLPFDQAFFLPLTAALAACTALAGVYVLGMCVNAGSRVSFAAGLILLSSPGFAPLTHYVGPEMLQTGLLALSLACLYKGWTSDTAPGWLGAGFILASAAALTGGLTALWMPLVSSLVFTLWRGSLRRAHKLDAVIGFGLLLLVIAGWLGAVILFSGESARILDPLAHQITAPWQSPLWPPTAIWWHGPALLSLSLAPWILTPLFVAWNKVLGQSWTSLKASRKEQSGMAWLWIALVVGLPPLLFGSERPWLVAIPLLPVAALLLAKALLNFSPAGSRLFFLMLSLVWLVCGVLLTVAGIPAAAPLWSTHMPLEAARAVQSLQGLPILAAVCLLAAVALLRFTNRSFPGGALTVVTLFTLMLAQPAVLLVGPSLVGKQVQWHPQGQGVGVLPSQPAAVPAVTPATPAAATPESTAPTEDTAQPEQQKPPLQERAPTLGQEAATPPAAAVPAESTVIQGAGDAKPVPAEKPAPENAPATAPEPQVKPADEQPTPEAMPTPQENTAP